MNNRVKVLIVGLGNMGISHAKAYHSLEGFEIVGLVSRSLSKSTELPKDLAHYPRFNNFEVALEKTLPTAVSINTWPNTHADYAIKAMNAGCHLFMEKPIATNNKDAQRVVDTAVATKRKLVLGYILRVHPSWMKFIELSKTLGKPLAMRLNLNQQSSGDMWHVHKNLIDSLLPIVDCGVHYLDVMCQMTGANPVRVHAIAAKLWRDVLRENYAHLHVTFDDGSVGWYEAGWGPMMSDVAFFVKDVVGPKGSVSIVAPKTSGNVADSANINLHTQTEALKIHYAVVNESKAFAKQDEYICTEDEPDHQELCNREQAYFLQAIQEDYDLADSMNAALQSLRIALAAEQSIREGRSVNLN